MYFFFYIQIPNVNYLKIFIITFVKYHLNKIFVMVNNNIFMD